MEEPIFTYNFWGEKHQGFDVMYHNMKHGSKATSDFVDFLRECCSIEDTYIKAQTKLCQRMNGYTNGAGSFTPCWGTLKGTVEYVAQIHNSRMNDWQALARDLQRYLEEQTRRHKAIKDGETSTQDVVRAFQSISVQLTKSKETYHTRYLDCEKTRRNESSSPKEIERSEAKLKKAQDEYKYIIERYNNLQVQFEKKMRSSCAHFQEVETTHLQQMRDLVRRYGQAWVKTQIDIGRLCSEFEKQHQSKPVEFLLKTLVKEKGTGPVVPQPAVFEEAELAAAFPGSSEGQADNLNIFMSNSSGYESQRAASAATDRLPRKSSLNDISERISNYSDKSGAISEAGGAGALNSSVERKKDSSSTGRFFQRRRRNSASSKINKKNKPETPTIPDQSASTPVDWRCETPAELPKDQEGFSIPPTNPWQNEDSSSSSSDDEDTMDERGLREIPKFEIKPQVSRVLAEDMNRATPSLPAPAPVLGRSSRTRSATPSENLQVRKSLSLSDQLALIGEVPPPPAPPSPPAHVNSRPQPVQTQFSGGGHLEDLFSLDMTSLSGPPFKNGALPTPPAQPRDPWGDLTGSGEEESAMEHSGGSSTGQRDSTFDLPPPPAPPPSVPPTVNRASRPLPRPPDVPPPVLLDHRAPSPAPHHLLNDIRGPSPAPVSHKEPLPLAVAFTETYNARFMGSEKRCAESKVIGELSMAFPVGIINSFIEPNIPLKPLFFRIINSSKIQRLVINAKLVTDDKAGAEMYQLSMKMSSLATHLRTMWEKNPNLRYFNIELCRYEVAVNLETIPPPLRMSVYWKCELDTTDLHLAYSQHWPLFNSSAGPTDVQVHAVVDGDVIEVQSRPGGRWSKEHGRATWRLPPTPPPPKGSSMSEDSGSTSGSIRARFNLCNGPGSPQTVAVNFLCDGVLISGAGIDLVGSGYRVSLCKKKTVSGNYVCEPEHGVRFV